MLTKINNLGVVCTMTRHLVVLSDAHLGAFYSRVGKTLDPVSGYYPEELHQALSQPNTTCVLNGDMFEFMHLYSRYDAQLEYATRWLVNLLLTFPECHFHFNIGNHDAAMPFITQLERLVGTLKKGETPIQNFSWSNDVHQVGAVLTMHGDLPLDDNRMNREVFPEEMQQRSREPVRFVHGVGNMVGAVLSKLKYPLPDTFEKIHEVFTRDNGAYFKEKGITDVAIGHTHTMNGVMGYEHEGLRFHITGSPGYFTRNNVLAFDLDEAGQVVAVKQLDMTSARKVAYEAPAYDYPARKQLRQVMDGIDNTIVGLAAQQKCEPVMALA